MPARRGLYRSAPCAANEANVPVRRGNGDYGGYVFSVENSLKDIRYFGELSASLGGLSGLATAVTHVFEKAVEDGHGGRRLSELLSPDLDSRDIQKGADK